MRRLTAPTLVIVLFRQDQCVGLLVGQGPTLRETVGRGPAPPNHLIEVTSSASRSIEKKTANHLTGKPPIFQKACSFGQLLALACTLTAELGMVYLYQQVAPLALIDLHIVIDQDAGDTPLLQIPTDADWTLAFVEAALDEGLGETLVALQTLLLKLVEYLLQQLRIGLSLLEFAL